MTYKDVEPIIEKLENEINSDSKDYSIDDKCMIDIGLKVAIELIKEQPVADVKEVRPEEYGYWKEHPYKITDTCRPIECSECGEKFFVSLNVPYEQWIKGRNYCRKCGIEMARDDRGKASN